MSAQCFRKTYVEFKRAWSCFHCIGSESFVAQESKLWTHWASNQCYSILVHAAWENILLHWNTTSESAFYIYMYVYVFMLRISWDCGTGLVNTLKMQLQPDCRVGEAKEISETAAMSFSCGVPAYSLEWLVLGVTPSTEIAWKPLLAQSVRLGKSGTWEHSWNNVFCASLSLEKH